MQAFVTPGVLAALKADVGDTVRFGLRGSRIELTIAGTVDAIPAARPARRHPDRPAEPGAALLSDYGLIQRPQEWWVSVDPDRYDTGRAGGGRADRHPRARPPRRRRAAGQEPYGAGARAALWGAAGGALLLALVGIAIDVRATARRRVGEFAVLRTLGAGSGLLSRALLAEQAVLAGLGVVSGLLVGIGVAATMAPLVILTPSAGRPEPAPLISMPWLPVGRDGARPLRRLPAAGRAGGGLHAAAPGRDPAADRGGPLITLCVRRLRFSAGSLALLGRSPSCHAAHDGRPTDCPMSTPMPACATGSAWPPTRYVTSPTGSQPPCRRPELRPVQVPADPTVRAAPRARAARASSASSGRPLQVGPRTWPRCRSDGTPLGEVPLHLGLRTQSGVTRRPRWSTATGRPATWSPARRSRWPWPRRWPTASAWSRHDVQPHRAGAAPLPVTIVGMFRPIDPAAPIWEPEPELIDPVHAVGEDGVPWRGVLLTDDTGIAAAMAMGIQPYYQWRFRFDEQRITTANLDGVASAAIAARHSRRWPAPSRRPSWTACSPGSPTRWPGSRRSWRWSRPACSPRSSGWPCWPPEGWSNAVAPRRPCCGPAGRAFAGIGGRLALEVLLVVPVAVVAAWLVGRTLPGPARARDWLAVLLGLAAVLAVPLLAAGTQRRVSFVGSSEMVRPKRSMRRVTAEASVLLLAGVGAFVLNQRGLDPERGVDFFVVSVPVLLAAAVALVALRLLPWPLRQLGRLTARSRGAVAFLGFARAGRATTAGTGPLAVLVVAVSTAIFSAVVASTIADGRDRATDQAVPGDVLVEGFLFTGRTPPSAWPASPASPRSPRCRATRRARSPPVPDATRRP